MDLKEIRNSILSARREEKRMITKGCKGEKQKSVKGCIRNITNWQYLLVKIRTYLKQNPDAEI